MSLSTLQKLVTPSFPTVFGVFSSNSQFEQNVCHIASVLAKRGSSLDESFCFEYLLFLFGIFLEGLLTGEDSSFEWGEAVTSVCPLTSCKMPSKLLGNCIKADAESAMSELYFVIAICFVNGFIYKIKAWLRKRVRSVTITNGVVTLNINIIAYTRSKHAKLL